MQLKVNKMNNDFDIEEFKFLQNRDNVSDEELVDRINNAPDMGGSLLVELSQFVSRNNGFEKDSNFK